MMLEIRYNTETKALTAWCGDEKQFGNLDREGHTVVRLDIPIPDKPLHAWLFNEDTQTLIPNPAYTPPYDYTPDRARLAEIVALSPQAITMPDMWEAIRILARFHAIGD